MESPNKEEKMEGILKSSSTTADSEFGKKKKKIKSSGSAFDRKGINFLEWQRIYSYFSGKRRAALVAESRHSIVM